jgi:hypothetical protein
MLIFIFFFSSLTCSKETKKNERRSISNNDISTNNSKYDLETLLKQRGIDSNKFNNNLELAYHLNLNNYENELIVLILREKDLEHKINDILCTALQNSNMQVANMIIDNKLKQDEDLKSIIDNIVDSKKLNDENSLLILEKLKNKGFKYSIDINQIEKAALQNKKEVVEYLLKSTKIDALLKLFLYIVLNDIESFKRIYNAEKNIDVNKKIYFNQESMTLLEFATSFKNDEILALINKN